MPAKMGRPPKKISKEQFEELCKIQCTHDEICAVLDVSADTLEKFCKENYEGKTFSKVFAEKRDGGKSSLRRSQWLMAEKNPTMAIWLGKQYLGQKDKVEEDNTAEKILQNMTALAEILTKTGKDRNIEDME